MDCSKGELHSGYRTLHRGGEGLNLIHSALIHGKREACGVIAAGRLGQHQVDGGVVEEVAQDGVQRLVLVRTLSDLHSSGREIDRLVPESADGVTSKRDIGEVEVAHELLHKRRIRLQAAKL